MKRNTKTKTIAIATALATLLSATAVLANTKTCNTVETPKFSQTQSFEAHGWVKSSLDSIVNSGTFTQSQEDAIKSAIILAKKEGITKGKFKKGHNGEFKTILDNLVKNGTITQVQEDSIKSRLNTFLDVLVADGTITQVQEDAIKSVITSPSTKGDFKKGHNGETKRILDNLVKNDTLTLAKQYSIISGFNTFLNGLVEDGTLTQDQQGAIKSAIITAKLDAMKSAILTD
jgi:hypothetical protein